MDNKTEFPNGHEQVTNFVKGRELLHETRKIYSPGRVQTLALAGYLTIAPNEIEKSEFLKSPGRMKLVDILLLHQMAMNDRIDMEGKPGLEKTIAKIKEGEVKAKGFVFEQVEKLPEDERQKTREILENLIKETEFIEGWVRLNKGRLTFDDVEKYRNVVNAIANCGISAIIFGESELGGRMGSIKEDLSFESVYKKYDWVFLGRDYQNATERAVMISHANIMITQIDDDWLGREIDRSLNIPSFASAALEECSHDEVSAKDFLREVKNGYIAKARNLGLGTLPLYVVEYFSRKYQEFNRFLTRSEKFREAMAKIGKEDVITDRLHARERAFVEGKI